MKRHNLVMYLVLGIGIAIFVAIFWMAIVATSHYSEQVMKQSAIDPATLPPAIVAQT